VSPKLLKPEELLSSWGIVFEGPVRKTVRTMLADLLDVEGEQFPFLTWVRKHLRGRA
jgi:hypothetical protein